MPHFYNIRPVPRPVAETKHHSFITPLIILLIVCAIYAGYCLLRPVGHLKTTVIPPVITGQVQVNIPWPANTEAAFGAVGYGVLSTHLEQDPKPTASVAKTITALAILNKHPLAPGEDGPAIPITDHDVAIYNAYVAKDGSVVPVYSGETVTERQALEAMMLPSANNMADTTAIWAFGSLQNYRNFASGFIKTLGMTNTTIGTDASGFDPSTTSTASDLVKLGLAALNNPTLKQIVSEKQAIFPNVGTISNVNALLGNNGVIGIKTGNSDQAGGAYLGAANIPVAGTNVTVVTAILDASTLGTAMRDAMPVLQASASEFQKVQVVNSGQHVGMVTAPWGASTDIIATQPIAVLTWSGTPLSPNVSSNTLSAPAASGSTAGNLALSTNGQTYSSALVTASTIPKPTAIWRLTHPL